MSTDRTAQRVLAGLVLVATSLVLVLMWPFASPLITAAAFAGMLIGVQDRLSRHLWNRRGLAAGILTFGVLFAILLPLGGILTYAIRDAIRLIGHMLSILQSGGIDSLIHRLPESFQSKAEAAVHWFEAAIQDTQGLLDRLSAQGTKAALAVTGALSATAELIIQIALFLIALFFLLTDGHKLVDWLVRVVPLPNNETAVLLADLRHTTSTVLRSAVLTALVQAVTSFVGFLIGGAPEPLFLALVTFFTAFVPAIGAAIIPVITGVAMILTGHLLGGIFLVGWGVLVVGLVDNIVKPLFIRGEVEIHGAVIFFSLLGGIAVFGPVGLIIGPMAVSLFLAVIRIARREEHDEVTLRGPHDEELGPPMHS